MKSLQVALVMVTGLGGAWAADQIMGRITGQIFSEEPPEPVALAQADPAAMPAPDAGGTAPNESPSETDIEELSEEEIEAELERIEQATGAEDELEEFVPSKPLAADIPVALPSDI